MVGQVPSPSVQHRARWRHSGSGGRSPPPQAAVGSGAGQAGMWLCQGALPAPHGGGVMRHRWQPARAASPCAAVLQIRPSRQPAFISGCHTPPPCRTPFPALRKHRPAQHSPAWVLGLGGQWAPPHLLWSLTRHGRSLSRHLAPSRLLGRGGSAGLGLLPMSRQRSRGAGCPSAARAWDSVLLGDRGAGMGRPEVPVPSTPRQPGTPPKELLLAGRPLPSHRNPSGISFTWPSFGSRRSCAWHWHPWQGGGRLPEERVPQRGLPAGTPGRCLPCSCAGGEQGTMRRLAPWQDWHCQRGAPGQELGGAPVPCGAVVALRWACPLTGMGSCSWLRCRGCSAAGQAQLSCRGSCQVRGSHLLPSWRFAGWLRIAGMCWGRSLWSGALAPAPTRAAAGPGGSQPPHGGTCSRGAGTCRPCSDRSIAFDLHLPNEL